MFDREGPYDGLVLAPVGEGGPWEALRALRAGVRDVPGEDRPHAAFVTAIGPDGRMARDGGATAVLVLGYRTRRASHAA
jgi:hypothetical protein